MTFNPDFDILHSKDEVSKAIRQMSLRKVPGPYSIPAEISKSGGPFIIKKLTELFQSYLENKIFPQEFKDATIVHICKRKEN